MKNDDTFSSDEAPSTAFPERDVNSDEGALSSSPNVPQGTSSSTPLPRMERRLTSHNRLRLLQVALAVVVLVALAGGYGVFRAVLFMSVQILSKDRMSDAASCPCLKIGAYPGVLPFTSLWPSLIRPVLNQPPIQYSF